MVRRTAKLLLLLGLPVALLACEEEKQVAEVVRPVLAMKVRTPGSANNEWFPGRAKATREVELSFRVAGPLIARPVFVGDDVNEGDVVAKIDPADFEANVQRVEGQLGEAKAALQRGEADFQRQERILREDPGATSEQLVDQARERRDRAAASVRSLEGSLSEARNQLGYTTLRAPFDGRVVATYVENFESVQAKQRIVRVLDTSKIEMVVQLPESIISYAPYARNIRVVFDAFPDKEIPAQIKEIGTEASLTTRTFPLNVIMDQPKDFKILPGMAGKLTGEAELPGQEGEFAAIMIPVTAVFSTEQDQKSYVWVIDEQAKTVSRREIVIDALQDTGVPVKKGLKAGEWIAVAGAHFLKEGQKVEILDSAEVPQ
ncbi:MAG: efflux RND transporter periplasmic adaptor subunit [Alphaproteobacteria bacterium]|nr:efflux RND transporter periplasmic adaptor subunit [Alphaproteobacteria bacterium]